MAAPPDPCAGQGTTSHATAAAAEQRIVLHHLTSSPHLTYLTTGELEASLQQQHDYHPTIATTALHYTKPPLHYTTTTTLHYNNTPSIHPPTPPSLARRHRAVSPQVGGGAIRPPTSTMDDSRRETPSTLSTSFVSALPTLDPFSQGAPADGQALLVAAVDSASHDPATVLSQGDSAINGVVIGLLSSFGSAVFIALVFLLIYLLRYTSRGRILLDRIGRPGQYDDEQAFAREEAEALDEMDDLQRTEYFRAKGTPSWDPFFVIEACLLTDVFSQNSLHPGEPARLAPHRHIIITVPSHPGEGGFSMGVRAGTRDRQLLRRGADGD